MKYSSSFTHLLLVVLGATFLLIAWIAPTPNRSSEIEPENTINKLGGIAVVELFTSQSCSSCPPADQLLSSISTKATQKGLAIYPLSFHVDYWNRLGWQDPFSQAAFSQRQRDYARSWSNTQVYTPQMVVNGQKGFVGSRQQEAWQVINEVLKQPATTTLTLAAATIGENIRLTYKINGKYQDQHLQVALVEKAVTTAVRRGENSGLKLHHSQVVRQFVTDKLSKSGQGQIDIQLPDDLLPEAAELIAYVQDPSTLRINGATLLKLEDLVN